MLDPKKLEQACRLALTFIESIRGLAAGDYAVMMTLRDALMETEALSADEARNHRGSAGSDNACAIYYCSCGQEFKSLYFDNSQESRSAALWRARRDWLLHLEEMRIRGLLS